MSALEEAREQARKALARHESQSANSPFHFGLDDHMYIALRALLDATEPRPITDEMVEAARTVIQSHMITAPAPNIMRAALAAAEGARR